MARFCYFPLIPSYSMSVPWHVPAQATQLQGRAAAPAASLKWDRNWKEMKPIPGMPSQTRTFDPAKTQVPSEQGAALTQESVLQSGAAEEPIKCCEMPSLVLVQAGWDVSSDPSVACRSKSRALPSLLFIPAPQSEGERRCPYYSPTTFELPR